VQRRHPSLKTDFPSKVPLKSAPLEPVRWDAPFSQALAHTDRQMMFIVPWLYFGGADIGELTLPRKRPRTQAGLSSSDPYGDVQVCSTWSNSTPRPATA
jgi:hypothetical protein